MASEIDPGIFYCFVLADGDPQKTSPFQGFSRGWMTLPWAMLRVVDLPADLLEPALPHQAVLARRMGGTGGWRWFPLALRAFDDFAIDLSAPFWVVFSGTKAVAAGVSAWEKQAVRPLHVTDGPWDRAITGDALNAASIRQRIETTLKDVHQQDASLDGSLIDQALAQWRDRPSVDATLPKRERNCTFYTGLSLAHTGTRAALSKLTISELPPEDSS